MKKSVLILTILIVTLLSVLTLSGCAKLTDEEKTVVGRYNLTQIDGLASDLGDITADMFEENYISLLNNKTFVIHNKDTVIINTKESGYTYEKTGKWSLDGETLTLKLSGMFSKKEAHTLKENTITMKGEINGKSVTMTFVKA